MDDQAQIISYEEYTPYGSTSYQAVRSQTETTKRYRYTGKERDEESGLYYHGVRYYAPWLGRWVNCDPAGIADGLNLYIYVRDSPTRFSDPSGASMADTVGEIKNALSANDATLTKLQDVQRRLAETVQEYSETLPKYSDAAARGKDVNRLGEIVERSQKALKGFGVELKAIEKELIPLKSL